MTYNQDEDLYDLVGVVKARAEHLISLETRIGKTTRIRKGRMSEDELLGRLVRMWGAMTELSEVADKAESLAGQKFETPGEEFLHLLDEHEKREALAPDANWEKSDAPHYPSEDREVLLHVTALADELRNLTAEVRHILAGRINPGGSRGAPPKQRGKEIAAQLLGYAVGLEVKKTRNREPSLDAPLRYSAVDVVEAVVDQLGGHEDPVADTVIKQIPRGNRGLGELASECSSEQHLKAAFEAGERAGRRDKARHDLVAIKTV